MNRKLEKALERVKKRAHKLSEAKRDELISEAKDDPSIIFEHIKNGHAVELYCVANDVPETLDQKDAFGMTPMHVSNVDGSGLATAILTEKPHASIWEPDNQGRIPLDVAERFENMATVGHLTRYTYPQFMKVSELDQRELTRLDEFDTFRKQEVQRAKTTPGWLGEIFENTARPHHTYSINDIGQEI